MCRKGGWCGGLPRWLSSRVERRDPHTGLWVHYTAGARGLFLLPRGTDSRGDVFIVQISLHAGTQRTHRVGPVEQEVCGNTVDPENIRSPVADIIGLVQFEPFVGFAVEQRHPPRKASLRATGRDPSGLFPFLWVRLDVRHRVSD